MHVYYIVFPVYYRLTLTQGQKYLHRYHIFSNTTGKHWIFAINKHRGKWNSIDYFINTILSIASSTTGSSCCWVLRILHIFAFQQPNITMYFLSLTLFVFRLHHQPIHRYVSLFVDTSTFIILCSLFIPVWP